MIQPNGYHMLQTKTIPSSTEVPTIRGIVNTIFSLDEKHEDEMSFERFLITLERGLEKGIISRGDNIEYALLVTLQELAGNQVDKLKSLESYAIKHEGFHSFLKDRIEYLLEHKSSS